jgi:hypothetical protein
MMRCFERVVWHQFPSNLSRVRQTKITNATTRKETISIQFWPSKPKKLNGSTRNSTVFAFFLCRTGIVSKKYIIFVPTLSRGLSRATFGRAKLLPGL